MMKKDSKFRIPGGARLALDEVWAIVRPHHVALLLGILLMLISRACALVLPASTKVLIDDVIAGHNMARLRLALLVLVLATVLEHVAAFAFTRLLGRAGFQAVNDLRRKVQRHINLLPVGFFDSNKTGVLISRIMNDVEAIRNIIAGGLIEFIGAILTSGIAVALMLYISPLLTCVALFLLIAYVLVVQRSFGAIKPIFMERSRINAEVTGRLTESLGGIRVVKAYNAEEVEARTFAAHCQRLFRSSFKALTATAVITLAGNIIASIALITVIGLGATKILSGSLTLGQFATFIMLATFLVNPISALSGFGNQLTEAIASMERIREVLSLKTEHENPARVLRMNGHTAGRVRFDDVSFAYEGGERILHHISFQAEPGSVLALVGPSGAGKSTIIGLIAAFYTPDAGTIYVDDADLSKIVLDSYRCHLGIVLQDTFLFDGTIRDNVAFARPGASEEEIISACRAARVDAFAERFESGYDTMVGERGVKLSGGEKQRISIARAILADPNILILDEATSSLDSESEELIQESLQRLMRDRTSFVIAHRLSTIQNADQVLVVEGGHIVEAGTPASLYAARGRYYDLYTKQYGNARQTSTLTESAALTEILS
jgi:ABC-type multidrug transport system fused ATPase/permease subunit